MLWWTLRQLRSQNWEIRQRAIEQLGNSGNVQAVEPLISALKDPHNNVRQAASEALGKIIDKRSVEPLISLLIDKDSNVRDSAVEALGNIGDTRAIEPLITLLNDKYHYVRRKAAEALTSLGWQPGNSTQRAQRAIALKEWEEAICLGEAAVDSFISVLKDKESYVRKHAVDALGKIGDSRAVGPLTTLLSDEQSSIRKAVAIILGDLGDPRAVGQLIAAFMKVGEEAEVISALDTSLNKLIPLPVRLKLIAVIQANSHIGALRHSDHEKRKDAAWNLSKIITPHAVEPLIAALRDENLHVRWCAAEALGNQGDPRAVEPLIAVLEKDTHMFSIFGILAVNLLKSDDESWLARGEKYLLPYILDGGWDSQNKGLVPATDSPRQPAAEALGKLGDVRAVNPLIAALKDKQWDVRLTAAEALGKLKDTRAVEPLITALKDPHFLVA